MSKIKKPMVLIAVIYIAFISLGLPDGVLGVAWPAIRTEMQLPLEYAGILSTILLYMTALSSFFSIRLLARWGTGKITFISGLMTGLAMLGYAVSPHFLWLSIFTIPLGLGQGAVDSCLNHYVAGHYTSRHMSWLHCFWGVGASLAPYLLTAVLAGGNSWRTGYRYISFIQLSLSCILLFSLFAKLWGMEGEIKAPVKAKASIFKFTPILALLLFFLYSGVEFSVGLWLKTVLVESRNISGQMAGITVSCFYAAIMAGRFINGFVVNKAGNTRMIHVGVLLATAGTIILFIFHHEMAALIGVICIGCGLAPIYPCMMHETPLRFEKAVSDKLIGYQVGVASVGGSLISSGIGVLLSKVSLELFVPILAILLIGILACSQLLNRKTKTEATTI